MKPPALYIETRFPAKPAGAIRLATWNINSVRLRLALVIDLIKRAKLDVLCLQETKTEDQYFPARDLARAGMVHQAFHGMKGYNGVAILSRLPFAGRGRLHWCDKDDSRHVQVVLPGAIELHNLYIPAGGDVPDPKANAKFAHKLRFLDEFCAWSTAQAGARRIIVGDLNVAPLEHDVWSHKQLLDVVSHTPEEVERLTRARTAHGWVDAVRHLHPEPAKVYSWWSYRNRDWRASDRGRRLDHIWLSPMLADRLRAAYIVRGARDWAKSSDHVPVIADIKA